MNFIMTIINEIKIFWNWVKSIYNEVKAFFVSAVSIIKDPAGKTSIGRIIVTTLVGFGIYITIKDPKIVFFATIIMVIGCATYLIMKFIENLKK